MLRYFLISCGIILLLVFSVAALGEGQALNGQQILEIVNGNTAEGSRQKTTMQKEYIKKSVIFVMYFSPNGELIEQASTFKAGGGVSVPTHGEWQVKKQKLCFTWRDSLRKAGKKMCHKVVPIGDGAYELYKGKG